MSYDIQLIGDNAGSSGSSVTTWSDSSGNSRNATSILHAPVVEVGVSSHNYLLFNGSTDSLAAVVPSADSRIFLVARFTGSSGATNAAITWGTGVGSNTIWIGVLSGNFVGSGAGMGQDIIGPVSDNNLHLFEISAQAGLLTFYIDGQVIGCTYAGNPGSSALLIGNFPSISAFWTGEIYEISILDTAVHQDVIRDGLLTKYGIPNQSVALSGWYLGCFNNATQAVGTFHALTGTDGLTWTEVDSSFPLSSPDSPLTGGDYSVMWRSGTAYCVYTRTRATTTALTSFGLSSSPDGLDWTKLADVDCSAISGVNRVWAPEWFIDSDGSIHVVVCCSSDSPFDDSGFQIYELHTSDFVTWSSPVLLGGMGSLNQIDPFIVKRGGEYFLWYKNETTKYIEVCKCASLTGTYSTHRSGDWMGIGSGFEGPTLITTAGVDRLYADPYNTGAGLKYTNQTAGDWTTSGSTTWSAATGITAPFATRHGTILTTSGNAPSAPASAPTFSFNFGFGS